MAESRWPGTRSCLTRAISTESINYSRSSPACPRICWGFCKLRAWQELLGVTQHVGKNGVERVPGPAMPRAWVEANCPTQQPVTISRPDSDTVILTATLACPGRVILSDTMYPGWEARVDGKPAALQEAWGALRGVAVDAGTHKVEMNYRPASVRWGAGLTAAGLLACLAMLLWDRRSRSR